LLDELTAMGAVMTSGIGDSSGGRKPVLYSLVEEAFNVIAIGVERFNAKMTIFNCFNETITPVRNIETNIDDPTLVETLYRRATEMIMESGIDDSKVVAVGIYMPGLIDSVNGINYTIKDTSHQNVAKGLKKKFGKDIFIENDARMQALGEFIFGKAKLTRNALVLNWSWGLGLGMIMNGQLYGGSTGFAGEFSHIKLQEDGSLCICGKRGCLETVASANKVIELAIDGITNHTISQLTTLFKDNPKTLKPEHVVNAARLGDEFSISILNKVGSSLGHGLSILIQLLNPEIIVIGGPLSKAYQFVLTPIQQALNRDCLEKISNNVRIEISDIDEKSGLLGLSALLFQKVFGDVTDSK
jgi:N-acetylglucosamine repressor